MANVVRFNSMKTYASQAAKLLPGGEWYPNTTNFPALKAFFHYDDVNDLDTTWVDRVSGLTFQASETPPNAFNKDADGVYNALSGITPIVAGSLPVVGDLHPVFLRVGTLAANQGTFSIGDGSATSGVDIRMGAGVYATINGASAWHSLPLMTFVPGAPTLPIAGAIGYYADKPNNESRRYMAAADGSVWGYANKDAAGSSGDINTTWSAFSEWAALPASSSSRTKIIALLYFQNPMGVGEFQSAVAWCAANPGYLYPGWAGRS